MANSIMKDVTIQKSEMQLLQMCQVPWIWPGPTVAIPHMGGGCDRLQQCQPQPAPHDGTCSWPPAQRLLCTRGMIYMFLD